MPSKHKARVQSLIWGKRPSVVVSNYKAKGIHSGELKDTGKSSIYSPNQPASYLWTLLEQFSILTLMTNKRVEVSSMIKQNILSLLPCFFTFLCNKTPEMCAGALSQLEPLSLILLKYKLHVMKTRQRKRQRVPHMKFPLPRDKLPSLYINM